MKHHHSPIKSFITPAHIGCFAVLLLLCFWFMTAGSYKLSPEQIWTALLGEGKFYHNLVIWDMRLPRLLVALMAGTLFGIAGVIFQSLIRNPLASPDIIGFNSGVGFGAIVALVVFDATSHFAIALSGMIFGFITVFIVLLLAWHTTPTPKNKAALQHRSHALKRFWKQANSYGFIPYRIVLVGIGGGFTLHALSNFIITNSDIYRASDAIIWLMGSVGGKNWEFVYFAFYGVLVLIPLALMLKRGLSILEMGADLAVSLGIHANRLRLYSMIIGILCITVAIALVGPIAFVSFVAGPIARRISPSADCPIILPAMVGAIVLVFADVMARIAIPGVQLSASIFTAIIGGPYLLWLLFYNKKDHFYK